METDLLEFNDARDVPCAGGCGQIIPAVSRRFPDGTTRMVLGNNPCPACKRVAELEAAASRRVAALERARLPAKLHGWRLDRALLQAPDEDDGLFMRRVRATQPRHLGVLHPNIDTFDALRGWAQRGAGWFYLHGPVGCGKSTLAAAVVEALAVPVDGYWRERSDAEMEAAYGAVWERMPRSRRRCFVTGERHDVLWIDEAELMARVSLGWSGDRDPLKKVSSVELLVLDDLGLELMAHTKDAAGRVRVAQAIERLVTYRYDHNLRTLITSNLSWAEVTEGKAYGRRVASRLVELCGGIGWEVVGPDWRKPVSEPPPKAPPKVEDRKARAADQTLFG